MTPSPSSDPGRAIMAYVREVAREVHAVQRSGPFTLMFSPASTSIHHNYALPDDDADPSGDEIRRLVQAFVEQGRTPVVEFVPSAAPALGGALDRAGFSVAAHLPLMTVTRETLLPLHPPPQVRFEAPESDAELFEMVRMQHDAFGEPGDVGAAAVQHRRRSRDTGSLLLVARDDGGAVVGAGMLRPPRAGLSEIVGVAVVAAQRRRGIAGAVVAELSRQAFDGGARAVYLEAEEGAGGAYARAGFRDTASVIHYVLGSHA